MRGELGILKKKQVVSQKDLEEQKDNLTSLSQDLTRLETKISNLEKDKLELKKEIKSRDNIILSKEKDISELKSTVRSMEKYKYVLNHKIGLLEEEIIPKVNWKKLPCPAFLSSNIHIKAQIYKAGFKANLSVVFNCNDQLVNLS